ncbi:hypothetical protein Taro_048927 [Colocasia esculenta]|uniref:Uncharacterized protein n=1 Tax=Colocasia esculenta TaxID=4460 RepID=A0A843X9E4_COLES|nr:hypothetical protein [Colocasia esculenta]
MESNSMLHHWHIRNVSNFRMVSGSKSKISKINFLEPSRWNLAIVADSRQISTTVAASVRFRLPPPNSDDGRRYLDFPLHQVSVRQKKKKSR